MISLVKVYHEHKNDIENFLIENIRNNGVELLESKNLELFFETFKYTQLLYVTDEQYTQKTPSFSRISQLDKHIGSNRSSIFKSKTLNEEGEYISAPYVCAGTGETVITVIKKIENSYIVFDFNLVNLLEELGYVSNVLFFIKFNKVIYAMIGYGLTLLSVVLISYALLVFSSFIFYDESLVDVTFKSIISLTLGLAVFDLGKNLLEHEVIYKDNNPHQKSDSKIFTKFLISIITALSIEALMLVLKISLTKQYEDMLYALYLIIGVSFMIASLALFYKYTGNKESHK